MTTLHVVAISMMFVGMILSFISIDSGPYLFAGGGILEMAGWAVAVFADHRKGEGKKVPGPDQQ
jgi:hypothetical protein